MASEVIKLNLIPTGTMPVFHASQFDTGRLITCELYRGEDAYSVPEGYTVELHCRKVDNNIVTMASTLINDNVVTFTSTEQLTACNGNNLCEVAILDDGYRIGTLNFILEVEIDPLKGGISSTSEIHNLETQIEEITTEVIGENYYNKTEVDVLLSSKADASSVYTKTQVDTALALKANAADVYTKTETNTLLNAKANASSVYTKSQTDTLLVGKADVSDLPDMTDYYTKTATDLLLDEKANAADVYTKQEVDNIILDIMPVGTASGPIASFDTELAAPLVNVSCDITATGGNGTPDNPNPINGYTEVNITVNGNTVTIAFGQTVYGGVLDVTRGKLHVTHEFILLDGSQTIMQVNWIPRTNSVGWYYQYALTNNKVVTQDIIPNIISDKLPARKYNELYNDDVIGVGVYNTNYAGLFVRVNDTSLTTREAINAYLSDNPIEVAYELSTPFDIDLTPEVISAIVGTNNVYSDTNGDTTVQYKDSIQHYIDTHTGG